MPVTSAADCPCPCPVSLQDQAASPCSSPCCGYGPRSGEKRSRARDGEVKTGEVKTGAAKRSDKRSPRGQEAKIPCPSSQTTARRRPHLIAPPVPVPSLLQTRPPPSSSRGLMMAPRPGPQPPSNPLAPNTAHLAPHAAPLAPHTAPLLLLLHSHGHSLPHKVAHQSQGVHSTWPCPHEAPHSTTSHPLDPHSTTSYPLAPHTPRCHPLAPQLPGTGPPIPPTVAIPSPSLASVIPGIWHLSLKSLQGKTIIKTR